MLFNKLILHKRPLLLKLPFSFIICLLGFNVYTQSIYQHTSKSTIYEFLQEVTDQQLIELATVIKPYSRKLIAEKLLELQQTEIFERLNTRQQKELTFFLKEYNKEIKRTSFSELYQSDKLFSKNLLFQKSDEKRLDALFYEDGKVQFTINPILGVNYNISNSSFQRWYGGEVQSYLGNNFAAWFSFRDVSESERLTHPQFLNQLQGGVSRNNNFKGVTDYSEVRGGITYDWKWGTIGLIQDQFIWGNGDNGATIFSGRTPSIPQLRMEIKPTKWLEFHYTHAWLSSEVVDSVRSYYVPTGAFREVYTRKYLAANMFIIKPVKNLHLALGNSIIYSDIPVQPAYLMPFLFYRSVDHLLSGQDNRAGQNGQLFFDVSIRNIKNVHLYGTLFIDELQLATIWDKEKNRNHLSFKSGIRLSNLLKSNVSLIAEYTRSNPYSYRHFVPSTTFNSSNFKLGNYLGDNSHETYLALLYKPIPRLNARIYYSKVEKGEYLSFAQGASGGIKGSVFLEEIDFSKTEIGVNIQYEWLHDIYVNGNLQILDISDVTETYVPEFQRGKNTFFSLGLVWNY